MKISWLWSVPDWLLSVLAALATVLAANSLKMMSRESRYVPFILGFAVIFFFDMLFSPPSNLTSFFMKIANLINIGGVICLEERYKRELFDYVLKALCIVLIITIPAWLMFLIGFPFPHGPYVDMGDGFHYIIDYTFFVVSDIGEVSTSLRFSSVFLEPGWIGTICMFALVGIGFNYKKFSFYLLLLAILLSMSLSAVVNLLVCYFLWVLLTSEHKLRLISLFIASLVFITIFAINYNDGNNAINDLVIERLVFDEDLGIAGNNRTNDEFDYQWDVFVAGPDKWTGMRLSGTDLEVADWYNSSSGVRKEILTFGYISFTLFLVFILAVFFHYRNKQNFVFLVGFIMASFIRNMWRTDYYLICYIITLSTLFYFNQDWPEEDGEPEEAPEQPNELEYAGVTEE